MIRFTTPWVLAFFPVVVLLITLLTRGPQGRLVPRYLALFLVLLAIAGPSISIRESERRVVFLIDRSASVASTSDETETLARLRDIRDAHPETQFGSIEFGQNAVLVSLPGEFDPALPPGRVDASGSRLGPAISLALNVLADAPGGQILLASDGRFTDDATAALALAEIAGVGVSVFPVGRAIDSDVALASVSAPGEVPVDRAFSAVISVTSSVAGTAQLAVYRSTELISLKQVDLDEGLTRFTVADSFSEPGFTTYRAVVRSIGDPVPENDALSFGIRTSEQPRVLVVEGSPDSVVEELLDAIGVDYSVTDTMPNLAKLSTYRQLILSEVHLGELTDAEAQAVDRFVRNAGGGLLVIQGEDSVRGFASTKLDDLLPVSSTTPETEEEASLALVYILDRSSSMSALVDGTAKIRILRDATAASAVLLPGRALVGVIGFDTEHDWLIPISQVGNASTVYAMLRRLRASGGTDLYYPLADAVDALKDFEARSKHILLITDGRTTNEPRDYAGLFAALTETEDVTVSAIALGDNPNLALLSDIVEAGRGSLYEVADFRGLPAVTLQVTQRLSRSRFVLDPEEVGGPLIERTATDGLPSIGGYVLTYRRAASQTLLTADEDPLAATWQIGLGAVTVLNTDLSGTWTAEWVAWPGLSTLFSELLRTTEPLVAASTGLFPSIELAERKMSVLIDARDGAGRYVDHLAIEAQLLPDEIRSVASQVAPGLYRAVFPRPTEGAYALRIDDLTRGGSVTLPVTIPYPAEYRGTGPDLESLQSIALWTGGGVLSEAESTMPEIAPDRLRVRAPIHFPLLLAALGIYFAELVARKWPSRLPEQRSDRV